jgi:phenylpropionate dioxygenase-like ring-hydroxylating dioxygenase large terminal subunit
MRTVTFPTLDGHWTPITAGTKLKPGKLLPLVLDGVPIVAFRDRLGRAQALIDRCPHRSIKLSIGKLTKDDTIQCAFHGWRFDGTGACLAIPLNPDAKLSPVRAQALACEEAEGLLWIYAGVAEQAPPLAMPAPLGQGWFGSVVERDWPVHWSRSVQTSLDIAHIPFVHLRSIGAAFGRALGKMPNAQLGHRLDQHADGGFRLDWWVEMRGRETPPDIGWVAFHPPHAMSLGIPQKKPGREALLIIYAVPLAEGQCRNIVIARRNFGKNAILPRIFDLLTPIILGEDKRNLSTAWPGEVPIAGEEVSVPSDVPSIAFQKWYASWRRTTKCEA